MIKAENGHVVMLGTHAELLTECTMILAGVYENIKKEHGEKFANELLTAMGRTAVDPKTVEEKISNMFSMEIPRNSK